jgi:hypothetical protein
MVPWPFGSSARFEHPGAHGTTINPLVSNAHTRIVDQHHDTAPRG